METLLVYSLSELPTLESQFDWSFKSGRPAVNEESLSKEWIESELEDDDDTVVTRTVGYVYHEPTEESSLEDESSN